jgi:peptide/nickel transport system permease protein
MIKNILQSNLVYSFVRDISAIAGAMVLVVFIFCALFAPALAPMDPYDLTTVELSNSLMAPAWMETGSLSFPLGTDDQGRGILSTILFGLRTSLMVGFSVVVISSILGIIFGMLGGYYGGILDAFIMRTADTVFAFSTTLLAILLLGIFQSRNIWTVVFAICIAGWVKYARTIRGSVLEVKENAYITAAKASGAKDFRILFRHVLPNALPPVFVLMAVDLAVVIMLEATLSFLGVGVPLTLILLVVGINLFSDWLRDEMNPRLALRS